MNFLRRIRGESRGALLPDHQLDLASIYMGLRDKIFSADACAVGIRPTSALPNVWGLVMDWNLDRGVATVVSLADGTTSMYFSSGGGTIGAGEHAAAAIASINALRIAESMIEEFPPSQNAPIPGPTRTALTLLTFSGLRRIEGNTTEFENGTIRTSPVANAMQEVIHAIRLAENDHRR